MFNFNELPIIHRHEPSRPRGSFVGIRKDKYLNKLAFTLPKGFDDFDPNYENVKNLFFMMYRTFEKFRQNHTDNLDKNPQSQDNSIKNDTGAYIFTDEENNETILYSKIDLIQSIFKVYQDLEIESLIQEVGLTEEIDYSKIENYLDKAIYLDNHAIFIENMAGYRNIVRNIPSELIELFCYIYKELASELEQEISEIVKDVAFNFEYQYLHSEQGLFSEYTFESTIKILKDCLDYIHKTTAYKNYQYWDIYEAVEHFLYGSLNFDDNQQGFWGINNFSYIWEDMCNHYILLQKEKFNILYCDTSLKLTDLHGNLVKDKSIFIDENLENKFFLELHGYRRWIKPDIIFKNQPIKEIDDFYKLDIRKSVDSIYVNNIDIRLLLLDSDEQCKKYFGMLYQYFFNAIKEIKNPPKPKHRMRKHIKPEISSLDIRKDNNFISIKNMPEPLFNDLHSSFQKQITTICSIDNFTYLFDWKYYDNNTFSNSNDRVKVSIIKQLAYEFCLSKMINDEIKNCFGIPFYDTDCDDFIIKEDKLDCSIFTKKINFSLVQKEYVHD